MNQVAEQERRTTRPFPPRPSAPPRGDEFLAKVSHLIDLKTSASASYDSWQLQLGAYAFGDLVADGDTILAQPVDQPWAEACAVLWVPRDKPDHWQFIELPVTSFAYETFLALREIYRWRESKPSGQLILPPAGEEIVA